jgi:hypothetical protein
VSIGRKEIGSADFRRDVNPGFRLQRIAIRGPELSKVLEAGADLRG